MLWKSTIKISVALRLAGNFAVKWGVTDARVPFTLRSLAHDTSATINNNTVSFNVQEALPLHLCMAGPQSSHNTTLWRPLDYLAGYTDAAQRLDWNIDVPTGSNTSHQIISTRQRRRGACFCNGLRRAPSALQVICNQRLSVRHESPSGRSLLSQNTWSLNGQ